jgi:hypothetical protein
MFLVTCDRFGSVHAWSGTREMPRPLHSENRNSSRGETCGFYWQVPDTWIYEANSVAHCHCHCHCLDYTSVQVIRQSTGANSFKYGYKEKGVLTSIGDLSHGLRSQKSPLKPPFLNVSLSGPYLASPLLEQEALPS